MIERRRRGGRQQFLIDLLLFSLSKSVGFSYTKLHIRKTERGSVGECLESHPPTQARTTSRHPPPRMKGSTARAHRHDATAAQAEAVANHRGWVRRRKA